MSVEPGPREERDAATPAAAGADADTDLVLLHGLGSHRHVFAPILPELEKRHRVHALDLPGFGDEHDDPGIRAGVAGLADWVTERLLAHGVRRPHVVGNSMGGAVALELGRRGFAGRVTAFAPSGFGSRLEREYARRLIATQRDLARRIPDRLARALRTEVGRGILLAPTFGHPTRVDPEVAIADMHALARSTAFDRQREALRAEGPVAPSVDVPTVIVWGRRDVVLPFLTQTRRARRLHPRAVHIALGECGHVPFPDDPETCAAIVLGTHPWVRPRPDSQRAA